MRYRRFTCSAVILVFLLSASLLAGCGGADTQKPDSLSYVKSKSDLQKASKATTYIQRQLYLSNATGVLIPQAVGLPETKDAIRQTLQYLVKDGPVTDLLPNGFQAVLPPDTEVTHTSLDARGNLTADFSKELIGTGADRQQILQSIVWTATQFDQVKSVTVRIAAGKGASGGSAGAAQVVGRELTRADGINPVFGSLADVTGSSQQTVYYLAADKGKTYEVPVTVRIADQGDILSGLVAALIHEPASSDFISPFNPDTKLVEKPTISDGVVRLHFNNAIFDSPKAKKISDQALRSLVLTLTGEPGIRQVAIKVGNSERILLESGKVISGPVSRKMVDATGL
ncbi:GerMN domain-containing protein [Sporolactobacillus vineae]|uniref:GerMN domain-containing protein n=1 Tax=Sporolactobacillus vineae TaxID=444463 RepID=UPI00028818C6|nr:GerMN domain-containing protein [Sporolactobacillus vineae]